MLNIFRFLQGFLIVKVSGESAERIINALNAHSVKIWNSYNLNGIIYFNMYMKDYFKIRALRKVNKDVLKVCIVDKYGMHQLLKKLYLRWGIFVGICLLLIVNILLSQFIWSVNCVGNVSIDGSDIKNLCEQLGVRPGAYIKKIDTYNISQNIALKINNVSWVSLNIEGCEATVNLTEEEQVDKEERFVRNIIASKDGVIKSMKVIKGTKLISVDQTVQKGELLVSGVVDNTVNTVYVASDGEIIAETVLEFSKEIKKKITYYSHLCFNNKRSIIEFFNIKIPLYFSKPCNVSHSYIYSKKMHFLKKELPIGLTSRLFATGEKCIENINENEAKNIALNLVRRQLKDNRIKEVLRYNVKTVEEDNCYKVQVTCYCFENIAEFQPIEITEY